MATQTELNTVMNTVDVYDANEVHDTYLAAKEDAAKAQRAKAEAEAKKG